MKKTLIAFLGAAMLFGSFASMVPDMAQADTSSEPETWITQWSVNSSFVLPSKDIGFYSEINDQRINNTFIAEMNDWNTKMRNRDSGYNLHLVSNPNDALIVMQNTDFVSNTKKGHADLQISDRVLTKSIITLTSTTKNGDMDTLENALGHEIGHSLGQEDEY
jgi:hypothetical protein